MLREEIENEIKYLNNSYIFNIMRLIYKLGFHDASNNYYLTDEELETEIKEIINKHRNGMEEKRC